MNERCIKQTRVNEDVVMDMATGKSMARVQSMWAVRMYSRMEI
jgi:hypothetical protein